MSYARFGPTCDVYIYLDEAGTLNCCGCRLQDHRVENDGSHPAQQAGAAGAHVQSTFTVTADMLSHLEAHRAAGHVVPVSVYDDLRADANDNDAWMQEQGQ